MCAGDGTGRHTRLKIWGPQGVRVRLPLRAPSMVWASVQ